MLCSPFWKDLKQVSNDFIFKGGNLLWHYIQTPRATIDLDLSTLSLKSHLDVRNCIEKSFLHHDDINFLIKEFKEVQNEDKQGSSMIISYELNSGQKNQFDLDIVYALPTDTMKINSTISGTKLIAASIENIISDKMATCHRFTSGNTRMKDYDDLWRISRALISIDRAKLSNLLKNKGIPTRLKNEWAKDLSESWLKHAQNYDDLPHDLSTIFKEINEWTKQLDRE